jgi:hypothetical protein
MVASADSPLVQEARHSRRAALSRRSANAAARCPALCGGARGRAGHSHRTSQHSVSAARLLFAVAGAVLTRLAADRLHAGDFGPELRSLIIALKYCGNMSEPKIRELLDNVDVQPVLHALRDVPAQGPADDPGRVAKHAAGRTAVPLRRGDAAVAEGVEAATEMARARGGVGGLHADGGRTERETRRLVRRGSRAAIAAGHRTGGGDRLLPPADRCAGGAHAGLRRRRAIQV